MKARALLAGWLAAVVVACACGSRTELEIFGDTTAASGRPSTGGGGSTASNGGAGAGGEGGADLEDCADVRVGHAFFSASAPDLAYLFLQSWIGDEYHITEINLRLPEAGSFDLGAPHNRNAATCSECVSVKHFTDPIWDRTFLAQSGTLEVAAVAHLDGSSSGRLSGVLLREVTVDARSGESALVPDGACVTIGEVEWQTAPCEVGGACPADMECLGTYFSTMGACVPRGAHALGEACSAETPSTDCQAGLDCVYGVCRPTCSFWAAVPGCPAPLTCNIDSRCIDAADQAAIGELCSYAPGMYCGPEDGRYAGQCIEQDGASVCRRLCRDHGDCTTACDPLYETASYGTCVP